MFIGELLAITILLDTGTLQGARGFASLVADYGPQVLRLITASALCLLVFGGSRTSVELRRRASADLMHHRINWLHLLAHVALVIVLAAVGSILFSASLPAPLDSGLMALWLLAGALAALTAALVLVPPRVWGPLLRLLQPVSTFAIAVAVGAYAFGVLVSHQWRLLSRSTMFVAHAILVPFISSIQTDPAALVITAPNFQIGVSAECSGYEGLGLILAFTAGWLWFHREEWRFPHALLLVPVGLLAIWMINCVRIAALVFIGNAGAHRIALGGFHSEAGWLGFNIVALGICLAARQMPWLKRTPTELASTSDHVNPTAAYVVPFLAILGSAMISRLGSDEFDWFYGLRVIACAATLLFFAPTYRLLEWRIGWISPVLGCVVFAIWIGLDRVAGSVSPATMPLALSEAPGAWKAAWVAFRLAGAGTGRADCGGTRIPRLSAAALRCG